MEIREFSGLPEVQKFSYLREYLKDDALTLFQDLLSRRKIIRKPWISLGNVMVTDR